MNLQNGKTFIINTDNNNYENHFIQSLKLNGKNYNNTWIDYDVIQKGGSLDFKMSGSPNKDFGVSIESKPFSMTKNN
jgi:putative alpha-1,2-mannosidase